MLSPTRRYILLIVGTIIALHFLVSYTNEDYGHIVSLHRLKEHVPPYQIPTPEAYRIPYNYTAPERKANAVIVMLARNTDVEGAAKSIKQVEDRFNKKFRYPYVFLNEQPFDENFKKRMSELTDAEVQFGLIPHEQWNQPPEIDEHKASEAREQMVKNGVIYGGSVPYRNMCRYNSGFFYRHELIKPFQYYWRVEPDVTFFCDLDYDPFLYMQDNDKMYGFTIALPDYIATLPTLWTEVRAFMENNKDLITPGNAFNFLTDNGGANYNLCHFWSNFEIANLDLWRGPGYTAFFEHLEKTGGFYYERWGDAPVHSIGAALFAKKEQIHFFDDIGYRHEPYQHCPQGNAHQRGKCWCDPAKTFDFDYYSCKRKFDRIFQ